jgi:hypothetical protein
MRRAVLVVIGVVGLVAACSGSGDVAVGPGTGGATSAPVTTAESGATTTSTETTVATQTTTSEATATTATTTTATTSGTGTVSGCPAGSWVADTDQIAAFFKQLNIPGFTVTARGRVLWDLTPDGHYTIRSDGYGIDLTGATDAKVDLSGEVSGTYTVKGKVLTPTAVSNDLKVTATVAGVTIDASQFTDQLTSAFPSAPVPFRCTGGNLELTITAAGKTLIQVWKPA